MMLHRYNVWHVGYAHMQFYVGQDEHQLQHKCVKALQVCAQC